MAKIFHPTSELISFLLQSIHSGETALPDFQRDFVWDPRQTLELIQSICQNFPAGSLLRIGNAEDFYFAPRHFEGAPSLSGKKPSYLILDGQQRLTSLYQAFYGVGTHRYFLKLQELMERIDSNSDDLEDCLIYMRDTEANKRYSTPKQQAEQLVFPLKELFAGASGGFNQWLFTVLAIRRDKDKVAMTQRLLQVYQRWLQTIEQYQFPMITLVKGTSAEAVCTIFETLNRTGVKLSVFDLLAARFWAKDVRLRDLWQRACEEHKILDAFQIEPYYILQAISLFYPGVDKDGKHKAPSCKRADVLAMTTDQINEGWNPVVCGFVKALEILRDDCGVFIPQWLPYTTMLIPAAAALAKAESKGPAAGAIRAKFRRWFWCSVFGQTYESSPNSQAIKDYTELSAWLCGRRKSPDAVESFSFDPTMLRQVTPRQRAVYRGVIALVLRNQARDFHKGSLIKPESISASQIDDHHVFPAAFLTAQHPELAASLRDCVLNRTLIDQETNKRIGKRAPSDYLTEISQALGKTVFEQILTSHLLPAGNNSPLTIDNFEGFLEERQKLIAEQINQVTR